MLNSSLWSHVPGIIRESPNLGSCWYTHLLKKRLQDSDSCYGLKFDFSDHIVLFFSHSFPIIIFEALFCFLFPFLPLKSRIKVTSDQTIAHAQEYSFLHWVLNTILPVGLLVIFVYLNIITLLAVHSTAAYFHSVGEVIMGYLISLVVQLPVGWIIWADGWKRIRGFVGFPVDIDRGHMD